MTSRTSHPGSQSFKRTLVWALCAMAIALMALGAWLTLSANPKTHPQVVGYVEERQITVNVGTIHPVAGEPGKSWVSYRDPRFPDDYVTFEIKLDADVWVHDGQLKLWQRQDTGQTQLLQWRVPITEQVHDDQYIAGKRLLWAGFILSVGWGVAVFFIAARKPRQQPAHIKH